MKMEVILGIVILMCLFIIGGLGNYFIDGLGV